MDGQRSPLYVEVRDGQLRINVSLNLARVRATIMIASLILATYVAGSFIPR